MVLPAASQTPTVARVGQVHCLPSPDGADIENYFSNKHHYGRIPLHTLVILLSKCYYFFVHFNICFKNVSILLFRKHYSPCLSDVYNVSL